ncbi:MAG: bifunctional adenosylcobinamide kinase/adenosylcobinamide-phosphate guanylyltransferase [Acidimicrobiales bacterium]
MITLIVGGARSGKSLVAERFVATLPPPTTYVATAAVDPGDVDFAARVEAHRSRRPTSWATIDAGRDLAGPLAQIEGTVLVDALGTWVAASDGFAVDLDALVDVLSRRQGDTVVVTEEVGLGVHPSTEVGGRFRDALGLVNQAVAEVADRVLLVVAGRILPFERSPW